MDREGIIAALELCTSAHMGECLQKCPYAGGNESGTCIEAVMADALALMKDRTKDYNEWSKQVGVHTCATCKRRDCDCPIENEYALPMDGYCHLWGGVKC